MSRIEQLPGENTLRFRDIVQLAEITQRSVGLRKLRLTGGEPLLRAKIVDLVAALAELGVPDLAMTTNGQLLTEFAHPLHQAGLGRVNISLDSLRPEVFSGLARGGSLASTMNGIEAALAAGLSPVRVNTVVMRGVNDGEVAELASFALDRGCEPRFIELMPTGLAEDTYRAWFVPADEILERVSTLFRLTALPYQSGSSSRRFRVTDARGRIGAVGLISPNTHPFCSNCRRLRVTADGRLLGCLGRTESIPIRGFLRQGDEDRVIAGITRALSRKRCTSFTPPSVMSAVGG